MGLVKIKKIILVIIGLSIGFLSGCDINVPAFLAKPDVYEVFDLLDDYYYKDLEFTIKDVNTVDDIIKKLNDPYTYIYEPDTRSIELEEAYLGIGITIVDIETGLLITDLNPNAGLQKRLYLGDIIRYVNGVSLEPLTFAKKQDQLRGNKDAVFDLTIKRGDHEIHEIVSVKEIPLYSVTHKYLDNKVGYIDINRFSIATINLFDEALLSLEELGMEGLVIDVRDNGGGYLTAVVNILQHFMTGDNPFVTMHRVYDDKYTYYYPNKQNTKKSYPIVILVNGNSASASEVLAIAMKEQEGYTLLGEKTFGKNLYQISVSLTQQKKTSFLNLTEGFWLSPDKNSVAGGLEPDIISLPNHLLTLPYPIYDKTLGLNDDLTNHEALIELLNIYEDSLSDFDILKTFSMEFMNKIKAFQTKESLDVTGTLNYETTLHLIDYYMSLANDENFDKQLKDALVYLVNL